MIFEQEDGGKGTGVSTYLVEHINHHSSGYPYRDMGGLRASTLPRQPKHLGSPMDPHGHAEDDGYVDALRRNAYNTGVGKHLSLALPLHTYRLTLCMQPMSGHSFHLMTPIHSITSPSTSSYQFLYITPYLTHLGNTY